jgi:hypothetical protein
MGPTGPAVPYPKEIQVFFFFFHATIKATINKWRFPHARPAVAE